MKLRTSRLVANAKRPKRAVADPTRLDPTRTLQIRQAFVKDLKRRFARVKGALVRLLMKDDALGLKDRQLAFNAKFATTQVNLVDADVMAELAKLQAQLDPADVLKPEERPHVTIRYGLHADPDLARKVGLLLDGGPIPIKLGKLSLFRNDGEDVLKVGVSGSRLDALRRSLAVLPHTDTRDSYEPHLTVAYLKPSTGVKYLSLPTALTSRVLWLNSVMLSDEDKRETTFVVNGDGHETHTRNDQGGTDRTGQTANAGNCGTGAGGFQEGNTCAKSGDKVWFNGEKVDPTEPANRKQIEDHVNEERTRLQDRLSGAEWFKGDDKEFHVWWLRQPGNADDRWMSKADRLKQLRDDLRDLEGSDLVKALTINAGPWAFQPDPRKVQLFLGWLKRTFRRELFDDMDDTSKDAYWQRYIDAGFKKGAGRAWADYVKKHPEIKGQPLDFYRGTKAQFFKSSFAQPVSIDKVKLLAGQTYTELEGVTADMSRKMSRIMVDGLVQGKHPNQIGKEMAKEVDIGETRAKVIARHRIATVHAEGQLMAFEAMGVEELGVAVEWTTSGRTPCSQLSRGDDKRGCVCELCEVLEGVVVKTKEAHGMLPRHLGCFCVWTVSGVGESPRKQKRTFGQVTKAIAKSVRLEGLDPDDEEEVAEAWGPAVAISKKRPKPVVNYDPDQPRDEDGRWSESDVAAAVRESLVEALKQGKFHEPGECDTAGGCRLWTLAFKEIYPEAEIWSGGHGMEAHWWVKYKGKHYDATGEQYGLPKLHVSKSPPKVSKPKPESTLYDDVDEPEMDLARSVADKAKEKLKRLTANSLDAILAGTLNGDNCGTGAGGFQPGNTCGKGGGAVLDLSPVRAVRGSEGRSKLEFGPDGNLIEGRIAGLPLTTLDRGTVDKISKKTKAALESALSDPEIIQALKVGGIKNLTLAPSNYSSKKGGPKDWTMAHVQGALVLHPKTAETIEKSEVPERKAGGLKRVIYHEVGHRVWDMGQDDIKRSFADALSKHPDVVDQVSKIVDVKANHSAFADTGSRVVTESFAELSAMRKYDKVRYGNLPDSLRAPLEALHRRAEESAVVRSKWNVNNAADAEFVLLLTNARDHAVDLTFNRLMEEAEWEGLMRLARNQGNKDG